MLREEGQTIPLRRRVYLSADQVLVVLSGLICVKTEMMMFDRLRYLAPGNLLPQCYPRELAASLALITFL